MNVLPENAFFPVPIERTPATPFWINPNHSDSLKEAEALLDDLFSTILSGERRPQGLGVRTKLFTDPFATHSQWQDYDKQVRYLKAERFLDPFSTDLGSGRNAILGPAHFKGIGRNNAATRTDWLHSWGGMTTEEALSEIIIERLVGAQAPQLSVPILGGFLYDNQDQAFIIRDSKFIRCEQISASYSVDTKSRIQSHLSEILQGLPPEEWHQSTIDGFVRLHKLGFFHESPTLGNITIDGRILDHYSLERIGGSLAPDCLGCEVRFASNVPEGLSNAELWKFLSREPITKARTSLDYVVQQCLITRRSFDELSVPTVELSAIEEQFRAQFFFAGKFLLHPRERPSAFKRLLSQFRESTTSIHRTDYGSIVVEFGSPQRRSIIRTVSRLVGFAKKASAEIKAELYRNIIDETLAKFKPATIDRL